MKIEITTPVLPNDEMRDTIVTICNNVTKDPTTTVRFFQEGADFWGYLNFKVMVLDTDNSELVEVQQKVMAAILKKLFNN